jgi:hypothetical protein
VDERHDSAAVPRPGEGARAAPRSIRPSGTRTH